MMDTRSQYVRAFHIFKQEDLGFGNAKEPSGYVRIECKDGNGKLYAAVQDLKEDPGRVDYKLFLLQCDDTGIYPVTVGSIPVIRSKGELQWGFNSQNVASTGIDIEKFNVIAVLAEYKDRKNNDVICPLAAYKGEKARWKDKLKTVLHSLNESKEDMKTVLHSSNESNGDMWTALHRQNESKDDMGNVLHRLNGSKEDMMTVLHTQGRSKEDIKTALYTSNESKEDMETVLYSSSGPKEHREKDDENGNKPVDVEDICSTSEGKIKSLYHPMEENDDAKIFADSLKIDIGDTINKEDKVENAVAQEHKQNEVEIEEFETKKEKGREKKVDENKGTFDFSLYNTVFKEGSNRTDANRPNCSCGLRGEVNSLNIPQYNTGYYSPCNYCIGMGQGYKADTVKESSSNNAGNSRLDSLNECMSKYFEEFNPFGSRKSNYKWWKINSPAYLNNVLYQCNIRTPLLFNPKVLMAHFKYRYLIAGIFTDRVKRREYLVCGVPGIYSLDEKPFGEMSRWVQLEGSRPRYGAFGYWIAYVDPKTGNLIKIS